MNFDCLKQDCQLICDIIELLAIVQYDLGSLNCKNTTESYKCCEEEEDEDGNFCRLKENTLETLQEFYNLIQSTRSFFLTDQCGNIITNKHITYCDEVYCYGLRTDIDCQTVVIDKKEAVANINCHESLPINRLLSPCFQLNSDKLKAFYEAVCCLKEFYKKLQSICESLSKCCKCCKCCKSHH